MRSQWSQWMVCPIIESYDRSLADIIDSNSIHWIFLQNHCRESDVFCQRQSFCSISMWFLSSHLLWDFWRFLIKKVFVYSLVSSLVSCILLAINSGVVCVEASEGLNSSLLIWYCLPKVIQSTNFRLKTYQCSKPILSCGVHYTWIISQTKTTTEPLIWNFCEIFLQKCHHFLVWHPKSIECKQSHFKTLPINCFLDFFRVLSKNSFFDVILWAKVLSIKVLTNNYCHIRDSVLHCFSAPLLQCFVPFSGDEWKA